jgi:hypothetical protein
MDIKGKYKQLLIKSLTEDIEDWRLDYTKTIYLSKKYISLLLQTEYNIQFRYEYQFLLFRRIIVSIWVYGGYDGGDHYEKIYILVLPFTKLYRLIRKLEQRINNKCYNKKEEFLNKAIKNIIN